MSDPANEQKRAYKQSTSLSSTPEKEIGVFGLHAPSKYEELYGKAPEYKEGEPLGRLFMDGRAKHLEPIVSRLPRELLPSMYSFDHEVLYFIRETTNKLDIDIPSQVDADNFTQTGNHTSFARLKSPAGYMQTPMSAKTVDNSLIREELGLTPGYSSREREIAVMVWREVWSQCVPSSVNVPKASAGGMRRMTHSVQWKLDYALWKTQPDTYDRYLSMVESADVYGLANDMEIVFGMYVQKRLQVDDLEKVRLANDWSYAISGGKRGKRVPTDKRVVLPDGSVWEDFSALRVRNIDAGPWAINCDLQMVASSHMKALFHRWPHVFHVNTKEEIEREIQGKFVECSDVSEYDQSMSRDAIAVPFEVMREYYPEGIVRAAERLFEAPYFAKPLEIGGRRGGWIANPMDWSFKMNAGNRSGHAMTSLIAKVNKVIETLTVFDRMYPVTRQAMLSFLSAKMPIGLVNNGDDEVIWSVTSGDMQRYKALRKTKGVGHYKVTPEVGQGYSGMLLVRPNPNEQFYVPSPRLQTPLEKMYVPERSIGGVLRPFWPIGWLDRIDALHATDLGKQIWDIHNFYYRKWLEPKYGTVSGLLEIGLRNLPQVKLHALSPAEREVLADPDKLHYKWSDEDVSDKVMAMITSRIPKEYVYVWLKRYYKGTFI